MSRVAGERVGSRGARGARYRRLENLAATVALAASVTLHAGCGDPPAVAAAGPAPTPRVATPLPGPAPAPPSAAAAPPPIAGDGDWPLPGRDVGGTRFSTLAQIRPDNVARLTAAWTFSTGTTRGQEAAP